MSELVTVKKFNAFSGIFLPTSLAILGAILYMRMGYLVGVGGLSTLLIVIAVANLITLLTAISVSCVATNMDLGKGGLYTLLSRTFGIETAGAIAIPLMLAQSMGIAFCISAFSESICALWPACSEQTVSLITLVVLTAAAFFSTDLVIKTQTAIFICIVLSLVSFFLGSPLENVADATPVTRIPFWGLFALFFPAVTGVEVGLAMSGEVKKPAISIPVGTIGSVLFGYLIYTSVAWMYSGAASAEMLISNPLIMRDISLIKVLIIAGIWGATLSGALSNLLGTPRLVESLAQEKILPPFIKGKGAIALTFFMAGGTLFLGGMNAIAPLLTMFFLIAYGMINFSAAIQGLIANPSWRPAIKLPWIIPFCASLLCAVVMLMVNPGATLIAISLVLILYFGMKRRQMANGWEDMRQSILLLLSRFAIYELANLPPAAKHWRPNLLVFIGDPLIRAHLSTLTGALTHRKGFLTMASIVSSEGQKTKESLERHFTHIQIPALIEVREHPERLSAMREMIDSYGLGPLSPNTIVLGATQKEANYPLFSEVISSSYKKGKNVMVIRENGLQNRLDEKKRLKRLKEIDVWWGGKSRSNSELMLILAYMLQTSREWRGTILNLKTVVSHPEEFDPMQAEISLFAKKGRLSVTPKVIIRKPGEDLFQDTILKSSSHADLVFLGLRAPGEDYVSYYQDLLHKTANFPPLAFVLAGENVPFDQILD